MPFVISIDFYVVTSCESPQWPNNGYVNCDSLEVLAGTSCRVGCFPGFELDPKIDSMKCVKEGNRAIMDATAPTCKGWYCRKREQK